MRILVTGASGFIGSAALRALLARGAQVAVLTMPDEPAGARSPADVETITGTLQELPREAIARWNPQVCLHAAWYAEPGKYLESPENVMLLEASLELIRLLAEAGCRAFVGVGSCAEYEPSSEPLAETALTRPTTLYAACKIALSLVGEQMARLAGMRFAWARIFLPYGPGEHPRRALPALIDALLEGRAFPATQGEQRRDYIHVDDIGEALALLALGEAQGFYNVCSGNAVSMRGLMQIVGELIGRAELIEFGKLPYRSWDPMCLHGNNARLRSLGWSPRIDLESGLRSTVEWWRGRRR
jgi:nucleoside-diphosphate-sugar epimerase